MATQRAVSEQVPVTAYRPPRPVATYIILVINAVVFVLMTAAGGSLNSDVLLDFGASYAPYFHRGQYWRLVMPMFLHIGWAHLVINAYALYVLGRLLEGVYGYGRFALIYVGAGMGGSFLSMERSNNVAAGASGAIFGMAGAMLVTTFLHRETIPPRWRRAFAKGNLLLIIVVNLVFGFLVPMIDNWGHLGGLIAGMLLAALIPPHAPASVVAMGEEVPTQNIVLLPVLVVALATAAAITRYPASRAVGRLVEEGRRLRSQRHGPQAVAKFQEAARLAPRDERPHEELGLSYLQTNRVEDAIREYNEALRWNSASEKAQTGLAAAYRQQGDLVKSQEVEARLENNAKSAGGQEGLANLYAAQNLYPLAIQHYEKALQLKPDFAEAHNNLAWLLATAEDAKFRDPRSALEHAKRAVELTRWKQPEFVDTLAEALYANRDYAGAVKVQTKTLALDPNNREYQEHMDRYRKAAQDLLSAGSPQT